MKKYLLFILFSGAGLSQDITTPVVYSYVNGVKTENQKVIINSETTTSGVKSMGSGVELVNQGVTLSGGGNKTGLDFNSKSNIKLTGNTTIDVSSSSNYSVGILLRGNSSIEADNVNISSSGATGSNVSYGIRVEQSSIKASKVNVSSSGYGILLMNAKYNADSTQVISDKTAINAQYGSIVNLGTNNHLESSKDEVIWSLQDSSVNGVNTKIIGHSDAIGILAQTGSVTLENASVSTENGVGVYAFDSTTSPTYTTNISINGGSVHSDNSASIAAYGSKSSVDVSGVTVSNNTHNTALVLAQGAGTINILNSNLSTFDDNYAIRARTNGKVNISGESNIFGNIIAESNSKITLNLNNSTFRGYSTLNGGNIDSTLNNSSWYVMGDSSINDLSLSNSVVTFESGNSFKTLTSDSLSGNGSFDMTTDIVGQNGDKIIVNGVASGNYQLNIKNNGASSTTGSETLTVISTGTNNANFTLANKVEQGAYEYGLRGVNNDVELYATGNKTTSAEAATSFLNIGYLTTYIENQTLLQRLGDVKDYNANKIKGDGLWIRGFGGKLNSFSGNSLAGFDMTYTGTQLGIDKNIELDGSNVLVGTMVGYTNTNPNYKQGDGTGKNYSFGVYVTYFDDSGFYMDNIIKYNNMRNQFNVNDTSGQGVKGKSKTHGISLSSEIGKRFWISKGFYLEPQAQISYGYQSGDTVHASNGLKVGLSHYNSTLGRVSSIAGYQIQGENPINIYVKTGVVREFNGKSSYHFNGGIKNNLTFKSNWWDNGVGVNMTINKYHNIYTEIDLIIPK